MSQSYKSQQYMITIISICSYLYFLCRVACIYFMWLDISYLVSFSMVYTCKWCYSHNHKPSNLNLKCEKKRFRSYMSYKERESEMEREKSGERHKT